MHTFTHTHTHNTTDLWLQEGVLSK